MPILDLSLTLNILSLLFIIFFSGLTGFLIQTGMIRRKNRRINKLEREMLQAHAEILSAQKEYCELESRVRDMHIPVISMITKDGEQTSEQKDEAASLRKKRSNKTA